MESQKKKTYEFSLLRRRPAYLRIDTVLVAAISVAVGHTFGMQLFDKENLLGSGALILTVAVNGVLLLLNHWSIGANQFYAYSKLKPHEIDRCTHVRAVVTNKK